MIITPGRETCRACSGNGGAWEDLAPFLGEWRRCRTCDGLGHAWKSGGPRFGCTMDLGDRYPGELVELATGDRVIIAWHAPRKRPRIRPETTFVRMLGDFTDEPDQNPIGLASTLGVRSVSVKLADEAIEQHDGEKDSDALDPFARRQREGEGPLL